MKKRDARRNLANAVLFLCEAIGANDFLLLSADEDPFHYSTERTTQDLGILTNCYEQSAEKVSLEIRRIGKSYGVHEDELRAFEGGIYNHRAMLLDLITIAGKTQAMMHDKEARMRDLEREKRAREEDICYLLKQLKSEEE